MFKYVVPALILLNCSYVKNKEAENFWIIWNVGQGQWITQVLADDCLHFDVGGEFAAFKSIKTKLLRLCFNKKNHILLSHWDLDHFIHIPQLRKNFKNVCWQVQPALNSKNNFYIRQILSLKIPLCDTDLPVHKWVPGSGKSTNDGSIIQFADGFLIPGDSTKKAEKKWSDQFKVISETRILILGHHGSRTSTSAALLNKLPHLKVAIVSARFAKYGHPHKQVVQRLEKNKTPVLKTEDWGSIWFL